MTAPAQPPPYVLQDAKMTEFKRIFRNLNIEPLIEQEVRSMLCGSKKVIVIDNSDSMNRAITGETHLDPAQYGGIIRRIDELRDFLRTAVSILAIDSPDGVDVYWLNDPFQRASATGPYWRAGVHSYADIEHELAQPPHSGTPLNRVLGTVITKYCANTETPMHCIVCLDGEPDAVNGNRKRAQHECQQTVIRRPNPHRNIINFKVCTDNDAEVKWINKMDPTPGIDISDDYKTERREVLRAGKVSDFNYGDFIVKSCIGAASRVIDELDEPTFKRRLFLALSCTGHVPRD